MQQRDALGWIDDELAELARRGLARAPLVHTGPQQARLEVDGRVLVNFGSNDYLALAADPRLATAAANACLAEGAGAGASPLVTGRGRLHEQLERELAAFEGTERALVFPSGYAANVGTICTLAGQSDTIYSDSKNHASLIDGCRLSRARVQIYPHGNVPALASLLSAGDASRRRLIVTESVFSMDGDLAPLVELADVAERYDCMLLVDEAHATGVFGPRGHGVAELLRVEDRIDVRIGTLSKALGAAGGFVAGGRLLAEWLVNRARTYIFSTALSPAVCAAGLAALAIVREEPQRRDGLLARAAALADELRAGGWQIGASASQIIPLVVGDVVSATRLSRHLAGRGILAPAIRPPSVPPGESLVRISLTCAHTDSMIEQLIGALAAWRPEIAPASVEA
ncbi:MAG TPA: 8-amino-7-oxononanoate synthase [Pirellulales bacterium]|nr:8-amino-7-oxononanoate synthase [Pirellulales bacterium]